MVPILGRHGCFLRLHRGSRAAGRHRLPARLPAGRATAFIAYSAALWQMSIWYRRSWGTTLRYTVDGLIYALLIAGTFGWLWPR